MCKVPGFGGESDKIVTSITAVGNRTYVTCRTPLIKTELHMGLFSCLVVVFLNASSVAKFVSKMLFMYVELPR